MSKVGKVFMLDDDAIFLDMYRELLTARGYDVFSVTNAYKFLLYAREVHPDLFILDVNMPEVSGWEVLQLLDEESKKLAPVVMLTMLSDKNLAVAKGVAHYLNKPVEMEKFMDIVDSYGKGGQNHDVLLIDDYDPLSPEIMDALRENNISFFEVNDLNAAQIYMRKNTPRAVLIKYSRPRFDEAVPKIRHKKIFYVENRDNIKEIALHLKD